MQKQYFSNQLKRQFELCKTHLNDYTHTMDIEALHRFRVSVKKIRALMKLAHYSKRNYDDKLLWQDLKTIYRLAADIRSKQMYIASVNRMRIPKLKAVVPDIRKIIGKLEIQFALQRSSFMPTVNYVMMKCLNDFPGISKKDAEKYLRNKLKKANKISQSGLTERNMHQFRKHLKQILYIIRFSDGVFKFSEPVTKKIDALQDLIGRWHDLKMMMQFIQRKPVFQKLNKTESNKLKTENEKLLLSIKRLSSQLNAII